jgi:hypothetical protein
VAGTFIVIEYVTDRSGVNEIGSGNPVVIVSALSPLIRIVTALLARLRERSARVPLQNVTTGSDLRVHGIAYAAL